MALTPRAGVRYEAVHTAYLLRGCVMLERGRLEANALRVPARVLPFGKPADAQTGSVGTVHRDGAITFRGKTYRTIRDLPPECIAFRADLESTVKWRALYRAIDPALRATRPR